MKLKWNHLLAIALVLGAVTPMQCPGPGPTPDPTPAPLSVLFVYESKNISPEQAAVLSSKALREYLDTHCVMDGTLPAYKFLDKDADVSRLSAKWQAAWAKAKGKPLPWMEVDNGKDQYSGAWGKTDAETIAVLRKYGGQ